MKDCVSQAEAEHALQKPKRGPRLWRMQVTTGGRSEEWAGKQEAHLDICL